MTHLGELIDQHRKLMAQAAGVQLEICMAIGDRDGARRAQAEMNAFTEARRAAAWMEPCYFTEQGSAVADRGRAQ